MDKKRLLLAMVRSVQHDVPGAARAAPARSPRDSSTLAHAGHHHGHAHGSSPIGAPVAQSAAYERFVTELHAGMARMMQEMHADPPSGDPDVDFLAMMIPHHWGAVEMARLVLRDGRDPLVRQLAEAIMASQTTEMAAMRGRLAHLRGNSGEPEFPLLDGQRGP
jgi:hypothetical protein